MSFFLSLSLSFIVKILEGYNSRCRVVQLCDRLAVAGSNVGTVTRRATLLEHDIPARIAAMAHQKRKTGSCREVDKVRMVTGLLVASRSFNHEAVIQSFCLFHVILYVPETGYQTFEFRETKFLQH